MINNKTINLGIVEKGSTSQATFSFSNSIINVEAGCGCAETVINNKEKTLTFNIKAVNEFPFQLAAKGINKYEKILTPLVTFAGGNSYRLQITLTVLK